MNGRTTTLALRMYVFALLLAIGAPAAAEAQSAPAPLYRLFLTDGSSLSCFGEWALVEGRVVFSMPVTAGSDSPQLHLVALDAGRVDWPRTDAYADAVRAAQYAAQRGEEDFARLSSEVARILNEVALVTDPTERLVVAERARRSLADWPGTHYGYRAKEVHEILGGLDEVIGTLRVGAGLGRFELSLSAATPPLPAEPLRDAPTHTELVQELMTAATLVDTPAEKVSLLQTVVGILDRAVDLLPASWAAMVRATALGSIAEEQKIDAAYTRLRESMLTSASRYAARGDVRRLERLRAALPGRDAGLGSRRPHEIVALTAAIDAQLALAHQRRLAHDQWLLRRDRLLAYQQATQPSLSTLNTAQRPLDDIRALAGPSPDTLRPLINALGRAARVLARLDAPAELMAVHALLRSASELAVNAAQLRLDAVQAADLDLAHRASSAAAGALMLLSRARTDLEMALRPPIAISAQ